MPTLQLRELLTVLIRGEVEFVLVGDAAGVAQGSSRLTPVIEVLASLTAENCARILDALRPYEPRFYQAANRPRVERSPEELAAFKNLYFETTLGVVDFLGSLPPLGSYADVAGRAEQREFLGMPFRVLSLDDLITVKSHVGRPKDRLVEMELRALRDMRKGSGGWSESISPWEVLERYSSSRPSSQMSPIMYPSSRSSPSGSGVRSNAPLMWSTSPTASCVRTEPSGFVRLLSVSAPNGCLAHGEQVDGRTEQMFPLQLSPAPQV